MNPTDCSLAIEICQRHVKLFKSQIVSLEEFGFNMAIRLVENQECMSQCVEALPDDIARVFVGYLKDLLEPVDFMPSPTPFIPGVASFEEIEEVKHRLRPAYIHLFEMVQSKVSQATYVRIAPQT